MIHAGAAIDLIRDYQLGIHAEEIQKIGAYMGTEENETSDGFEAPSDIAVIDVIGPLVNRTYGIDALCGMQSYEQARSQLINAVNDPSIGGILVRYDTPGGECSGVFEFANTAFRLRGQKPIFGACSMNCHSAGYLMACATCDTLYVSPTSGVGNVGVIAQLQNRSKFNEKVGFEYLTLFAGKHKARLNPNEKYSKEDTAWLQAKLDSLYGRFTASVATFRGISQQQVIDTNAEAMDGEEAIAAGLADEMSDEGAMWGALEGLVQAIGKKPTLSGRSPARPSAANRLSATAQSATAPEATNTTISGEAASALPNPTAEAAGDSPKGESNMENENADATTAATDKTEQVTDPVPTENKTEAKTGTGGALSLVGGLAGVGQSPVASAEDVIGLTALAGFPEKAQEVLALVKEKGLTLAQLRGELLTMKNAAETDNIRSIVSPNSAKSSSTYEKAELAAKQKASSEGIHEAVALDKVLASNPEAYDAYLAANPSQRARA